MEFEEWICSSGAEIFRCCGSSSRSGKQDGSCDGPWSGRASVDAIGCWYTSHFLVLSLFMPRTCSKPFYIAMVSRWSFRLESLLGPIRYSQPNQERVAQRFKQSQGQHRGRYLSLCKRYVNGHGGFFRQGI